MVEELLRHLLQSRDWFVVCLVVWFFFRFGFFFFLDSPYPVIFS